MKRPSLKSNHAILFKCPCDQQFYKCHAMALLMHYTLQILSLRPLLEREAQNPDLRCQPTTVNLLSAKITSMISTASLSKPQFLLPKFSFFYVNHRYGNIAFCFAPKYFPVFFQGLLLSCPVRNCLFRGFLHEYI